MCKQQRSGAERYAIKEIFVGFLSFTPLCSPWFCSKKKGNRLVGNIVCRRSKNVFVRKKGNCRPLLVVYTKKKAMEEMPTPLKLQGKEEKGRLSEVQKKVESL